MSEVEVLRSEILEGVVLIEKERMKKKERVKLEKRERKQNEDVGA